MTFICVYVVSQYVCLSLVSFIYQWNTKGDDFKNFILGELLLFSDSHVSQFYQIKL